MSEVNTGPEYEDKIPKEIAEIQKAISAHDSQRVKLLLTNEILDEVQKGHLVELAKSNGTPAIVKMIEDTPATP
ncbi:hypothetical protein [Alteromonas sp. ASW11-130]|uniref:hypothetical protein n=1 Tax=Alteromonas sp. ASW11-130 TaxID=3015775 RepID=UPI002241EF4A|nr:hypothetical protein [Alteromonas sp. ASW11-130]MCW8090826.1 hypothetical protein [Alteromonas sp. ASW11-130]